MTGWDVLSRLRTAEARVPVVFMSAGLDVQAEAAKHRADGALAKPFAVEALVDTVTRFVPRLSP